MIVRIYWDDGWKVSIRGQGINLIHVAKDYKYSFFWKKYEKDLDANFIMNYVRNK
jgi:hypothetical protein